MKKIFFVSLVLSLSLLFTSCETLLEAIESSNPQTAEELAFSNVIKTGSNAFEELTIENEYYIGRAVAAAITNKYKIYYGAPKTTEYLNKICNAIVLNSGAEPLFEGYHVAIMDTNDINAMATPGGHIFVSKGLISCTDSEDALAAVLAHEIAHIQLKHSIKAIKKSRRNSFIGSAISFAGLMAIDAYDIPIDVSKEDLESLYVATDVILGTLINSGYSKAQEFEADKKALSLMNATGYDPNAMLDMLNMVKEKTSGAKSGWNSTHPSPEKRIKKVSKQLKKITFTGSDKSVRQERFNKNKF